MNLQDARGTYETFSGNASTVARQLSMAAIGIAWAFKADGTDGPHIPHELGRAATVAVAALALDFCQYAYGAALWGMFHRIKERKLGLGSDADFGIRTAANWPTITLFWLKLACVVLCYLMILIYLAPKFLG